MKLFTKNLLLLFVVSAFLIVPVLSRAVDLEIGIGTFDNTDKLTEYIATLYRFATGLVGGFAVIMIVIGGIQYATAAGNQQGIASAKETITSAIIGLVVVGLAWMILGIFSSQFIDLKEPTIKGIPDSGSFDSYNKCERDAGSALGGYCVSKKVSMGTTPPSDECDTINEECEPNNTHQECARKSDGSLRCLNVPGEGDNNCPGNLVLGEKCDCEDGIGDWCIFEECCPPLKGCKDGPLFDGPCNCYERCCEDIKNPGECEAQKKYPRCDWTSIGCIEY